MSRCFILATRISDRIDSIPIEVSLCMMAFSTLLLYKYYGLFVAFGAAGATAGSFLGLFGTAISHEPTIRSWILMPIVLGIGGVVVGLAVGLAFEATTEYVRGIAELADEYVRFILK
jgi:hypothetical protein